MKKNKGFTLIELLAVIVILAVIALIAVPIILNVVEKSRESSAVDSAYGYINAIETNLATAEVKSGLVAENKEYSNLREFEETYNITVKGTKPESGTFTLEKRKVVSAEFMIDGYNIVCNKRKCESRGKNIEVVITYNLNGGTLDKTEDRVMTNSTLNLPTPTKNDYSFVGWYTEENGGEEVTNETPITSELTLYARYVKTINNFEYTGKSQTITLPKGRYKLEVWGARGDTTYNNGSNYLGGYSTGVLTLSSSTELYVYVGYQGTHDDGGWNGGGDSKQSGTNDNGGGGGATDISLQGTANSSVFDEEKHWYSRIIVAGGGGAGRGTNDCTAAGVESDVGGKQTSAGSSGYFGKGASIYQSDDDPGGGGGWYGGGIQRDSYSGGGSNWVYTEATYNYWVTNSTEGQSGKWLLDSSYYLTDASTLAGNQTFKAPNGSNETGHSGNGYARITYVGKE